MAKCTKRWTMQTGVKIRICDMGDRHLRNTILMLRRAHQDTLSQAYRLESTVRGEMAEDAAASIVARLEDSESDHPLYEDLVDEARRRGIELD